MGVINVNSLPCPTFGVLRLSKNMDLNKNSMKKNKFKKICYSCSCAAPMPVLPRLPMASAPMHINSVVNEVLKNYEERNR